ncbi:MAG: FAD-dependent thymidylate synthase [Deltaproteobacteria bacterium]|nr:FAD-dependent thymidylate synthase [Deltaproteobacteria bacterium]
MKIILAGYNLDSETIREFQEQNPEAKHLTPETISAAYARISRSPKSVDELRDIARREVEKARQSNRNIVFEMGHSSVAEHAVFNIDVLGVSRLLVEEIEKFRLCSYTEKSQRYVLFKDDFHVPEEIRAAGFEESFVETVREQNRVYQDLYGRLKPHVFKKYGDLAADPANSSMLEGWAKEDARYVIALATETQLGMTINARNLELMLRRLAAHPLAEAREFSGKLYEATKDTAPSLIRYTEATDYDRLTRKALKGAVDALLKEKGTEKGDAACLKDESVTLLHATPHADDIIVAALIHSSSDLPMTRCMEMTSLLDRNDKERIIKTTLRHMKSYDTVLREFENVYLHFELIISASCFAQMKRHRMATITSQDYDPSLGVTVPPAISEIGMEEPFLKTIKETGETYRKIAKTAPMAAAYTLTNAHRKRVAMKINARELHHIARLRADRHAQWDIRAIAEAMIALGKEVMPMTLMLATGKDGFSSLYHQVMEVVP